MVNKVKLRRCLDNVVAVENKNGKSRVCVDFTDLNKAFSKYSFPRPHIHYVIEATVGHEILTSMDASVEYEEIQMETSD